MKLDLKEYKIILENSPNLVWRSGLDKKCDYFNQTWLNFTGRTLDEELGNGWTEGIHPDDYDRCLAVYTTAFDQRVPFEMNYRLRRHDGEYRFLNDRGVPYFSEEGQFLGYIGSCIDVTEKIEGELLKEMAINDGLTGIYNRQHFNQLLTKEMSRCNRKEQPLSLMMIDIDRFKQFNDQYGHKTGDDVLVKVVETIKQSIREYDEVGRFGGDEFMVFLPETTSTQAKTIGKRIVENLKSDPFTINHETVDIFLSIGIAQVDHGNDFEDVLNKADKAMYQAKTQQGYYISIFEG